MFSQWWGGNIPSFIVKITPRAITEPDELLRLIRWQSATSFTMPLTSTEEKFRELLEAYLCGRGHPRTPAFSTFLDERAFEEAAADASLLIASSVETTSQALVTLIRHVYTQPDVLVRLRKEIGVFPDLIDCDFGHLEYLNACVNEALRILPPFPLGTRINYFDTYL